MDTKHVLTDQWHPGTVGRFPLNMYHAIDFVQPCSPIMGIPHCILHWLTVFCFCAVSGCGQLWESNAGLKACYQFNLLSLLTWSQALTSCQSQGGSLLSITHAAEHSYIKGAHSHVLYECVNVSMPAKITVMCLFAERLADMSVIVWTGLNHLADAGGWRWSDGSPLALLQYISG